MIDIPGDRTIRVAVVQLDYWPRMFTSRDRLWVPDEPFLNAKDLLRPGKTSPPKVLDTALQEPIQEANTDILEDAIAEYEHYFNMRLKQIYTYLVGCYVDIAVFPESAIPPGCLTAVAGFREQIATFAGIGTVRDVDTDVIRQAFPELDTEGLVERNLALFVDTDSATPVTKRYAAHQEVLVEGSGPVEVSFGRRDVRFRVGLRICMDYLQRPMTSEDICLVSALSSSTHDFRPKTPRGLLLVANHASPGGSFISMAHLDAPSYGDAVGTIPLPPGSEGVYIADWSGEVGTPKPLASTSNRLRRRSAIVYDDRTPNGASQGSAFEIARTMANWQGHDLRNESLASQMRANLQYLETTNANEILRSSLKDLSAKRRSTLNMDLDLYVKHLQVAEVPTLDAQRASLIVRLQAAWLELATQQAEVGALLDAAVHALRELRPTLPVAASNHSGAEDAAKKVLLHLRLGAFDEKESAESLARQLQFLYVLASYNAGTVSLEYQLYTLRSATGDLLPYFDVTLLFDGDSEELVRDLTQGLGRAIETTFRDAYAITSPEFGDQGVPLRHRQCVRLGPKVIPQIREDWAPLIDYLRSLDEPMSLVLRARPTGQATTFSPEPASEPRGFFSEVEQTAANFFHRVSSQGMNSGNGLSLEVEVGSHTKFGPGVFRSVITTMFGVAADQVLLGSQAADRPSASLSPEQLVRIFHPPFGHIAGRGLTSQQHGVPMPALPVLSDGIDLGSAKASTGKGLVPVPARLSEASRAQHLYILGRSGSGKTNLMKVLARQDLKSGSGMAVVDPHGDLVDYLLGHVGTRMDEVTLLDFGDRDELPVLNPLDLDVESDAELKLAIEDFINLLTRQSYHEFYGPRFDDLVRMALQFITSGDYPLTERTVLEVERLLRTSERRRWIAKRVSDPDLKARWVNFDQQSGNEVAELLNWALAKFGEMGGDQTIGQVLGGGRSTVSIRNVVLNDGILLVKLPEWELSRSSAQLLGSYILERIRKAVYRRASSSEHRGARPFYLYVDEFQTFATTDFDSQVAEARKFGLGLILANQNLQQLEEFSRFSGQFSSQLKDAIMGNVLNLVVFGSSSRDNRELAEELDIKLKYLADLPQYQAMVRALHDRETMTYSISIPLADGDPATPESRAAVRIRQRELNRVQSRDALAEAVESREAEIARHISAPKIGRTYAHETTRDTSMSKGQASNDDARDDVSPTEDIDSLLAEWKRRIGTADDRAKPDDG